MCRQRTSRRIIAVGVRVCCVDRGTKARANEVKAKAATKAMKLDRAIMFALTFLDYDFYEELPSCQ